MVKTYKKFIEERWLGSAMGAALDIASAASGNRISSAGTWFGGMRDSDAEVGDRKQADKKFAPGKTVYRKQYHFTKGPTYEPVMVINHHKGIFTPKTTIKDSVGLIYKIPSFELEHKKPKKINETKSIEHDDPNIIDHLMYSSYEAQRDNSPEVEPTRWRGIFGAAADRYEKIYQSRKTKPTSNKVNE